MRVGFGYEQPPVRSRQLDAGTPGRVQPMGRTPYVADLGHRGGPPCDPAHPHRREAQPPPAAVAGRIEQPSDRSREAVVKSYRTGRSTSPTTSPNAWQRTTNPEG